MYGDSSSIGFVGRIVIHELLHVGSSAAGQFSHWDMFKAGYSVAQNLGLKLGTRNPTDLILCVAPPPATNDTEKNSNYFHNTLQFAACNPYQNKK